MDKKIMLKRMRRSPQFIVGSILVLFLLFIAVFAKILAPCDPNAVNTALRLKPPGFANEGITYLPVSYTHLDVYKRQNRNS